MFETTMTLSTTFGDLLVTAEVERGHYSIGTVRRPDGSPVAVTVDVLEEIEMSIAFEAQCARFDALFFAADDAQLIHYHA